MKIKNTDLSPLEEKETEKLGSLRFNSQDSSLASRFSPKMRKRTSETNS